jgi:hypothetical protein
VIFQQVQARDIHVGDKIIHHLMEKPPLWVHVPSLPSEFFGSDDLVMDLVERLLAGQSPLLSAEGLPGSVRPPWPWFLSIIPTSCATSPMAYSGLA